MKYFAQTLFGGSITINSANTANTSDQFDIGEITRLWIQKSATGVDSTSDLSVLLQLSADPMGVASVSSQWTDEGSANSFVSSSGAAAWDKFSSLGAQKGRVKVTRNSGAMVLTLRVVGKQV